MRAIVAASPPQAARDHSASWVKHSIEMRRKYEMPPDHKPWSSCHLLRGVPQSDRMVDLIDIAWFVYMKENKLRGSPERVVPKLFLDLSQDVHRRPWSPDVATLIQGCLIYSFELDAILTNRDHGWVG